MSSSAQRAVVIGGSIGGLLAARVLSERFAQVTIVERDELNDDYEPRKGAPQGRNVHVLFGGGVRVVESLFPGFFEELAANGSVVCDFARDLCWYHGGVWKARPASDLVSYWQSRPFLETQLRRRLLRDTNVEILSRTKVVELTADPDRKRITGVTIRDANDAGHPRSLPADLVVDASGRGSVAPKWLEWLGYEIPAETTVEVNIGYSSRLYSPPAGERDWKIMALYGTPPGSKRTGYIFPIEGGRWLVSIVGFLKDFPPDDDAGFLEFARTLELPDFYEALREATPLSAPTSFRFPANRWRHYESLRHFPAGFLVLGDAISTFNPVYGQGMSVCALEVDCLRRMLDERPAGEPLDDRFAARFFRSAAKIVATPWLLATQSDFLYPETVGRRTVQTRPLNWYFGRVLQLCSGDKRVLEAFYGVLHFIRPPTALFHPRIVWSVLKRALGVGGGYCGAKRRPGPGT